jgi:hypothetical protein
VIIDSPRAFQIWYYSVSHARLLLRANPLAPRDDRIEVLFKGVDWMSATTFLDGLRITQLSPSERAPLLEKLGAPTMTMSHGEQVYRLDGSNLHGAVVALAAFVRRDQLDYCDPSPWPFYE